MRSFLRAVPPLAALVVAVAAPGASLVAAQETGAEPYRADDESVVALNILPPGQGRYLNSAELVQFEATGELPEHNVDQRQLYASLPPAAPDIAAGEIADYFKDASFGVRPDDVAATSSPREGVTIVRDESYGVPHVYGETRADVMFGAGYVTAEDRLFMMDTLRHVGRGRLSEFLGASQANLASDRAQYRVADYTEEELLAMGERLLELDPELGAQAWEDVEAYAAGVNAFIDEAIADPAKLPGEYPALQQVPREWTPTDTVAVASLIGGQLGVGGGDELQNAAFLGALEDEGYSRAEARRIMEDLHMPNDPEAWVQTDDPYPWNADLGPTDPDAVAVPDRLGAAARAAEASEAPRTVDGPFGPIRLGFSDGGMSNALLAGADLSATGRPLAVFGPQVGYWSPEILNEMDLHGPGIEARGVGFPGISLYILLGRGAGYGWSATSASGDLVDTLAVELCEPDASEPTEESDHYVRGGECVEMYARTDSWFAKPSAGGIPDPNQEPVLVEMTTRRADVPDETVPGGFRTGIVQATGTVDGTPVAFVRVRSSYGAEVDSALTYVELMNPDVIQGPADFQEAFARFSFTFNWFYLDGEHIAWQLGGYHPVRADGVDPLLPVWADPRWAWRDMLSFEGTPKDTDPEQGFITSWNNKQAPGFRSADDNWSFGPVDRSQLLDLRILAAKEDDGKVSMAELVNAMGDAASVDLRGDALLPLLLDAIGDPGSARLAAAVELLAGWQEDGAHRLDRDGDGEYDDQAAVALMDAWYPRMLRAVFRPVLGEAYDDFPATRDDAASSPDHNGSSYNDGLYGQVHKDLRTVLGMPVEGPFSRSFCGEGDLAACRAALLASLDEAVAELEAAFGAEPAGWDHDEADDEIRFSAVGVVGLPPIPWQNRPTFQQVLEFEGPADVTPRPCRGVDGGDRSHITGTPGDDTLRGTPDGDVICGRGGNDVIRGRGGNDIILGGLGRDELYGQAGRDRIEGYDGRDFLAGGRGNDRLDGGPRRDRCVGGPGNDRLSRCESA